MKKEDMTSVLIEALEATIDLLDQYEKPRKEKCGKSSVTRNAAEYVLRKAKELVAKNNN
jgi:hypothetical protein